MNPGSSAHTRQRILKGAVRAVEQRGLSKLGMSEVSRCAGVSRATLYRYFPTRERLLDAVAVEEGERFFETVLRALREAEGEDRIEVMLQLATRHVREHRALQRLLETEQAFLLDALREQYPRIRDAMGQVLAPLFEELVPVREGIVTADELVDWTTRLMISTFLVPSGDLDKVATGLMSVFRMLNSDQTAPVALAASPATDVEARASAAKAED
jgi:AcrR family transcriptional regulator